jgi:hypothetical protein
MRININKDVLPVALEVREWLHKRARSQTHDMCGYCGVGSAELWRRLQAKGIASTICVHVSSFGHVFLEVDGHVVDVTASQFYQLANTRVAIFTEGEAKAYDFYEVAEAFQDDRELIRWQKSANWPRWQVAKIPRQGAAATL